MAKTCVTPLLALCVISSNMCSMSLDYEKQTNYYHAMTFGSSNESTEGNVNDTNFMLIKVTTTTDKYAIK
jgi:hypothetical protein